MLHLDNGGNNALYREWFDSYFANGGADFECIGLSYFLEHFLLYCPKCKRETLIDLKGQHITIVTEPDA